MRTKKNTIKTRHGCRNTKPWWNKLTTLHPKVAVAFDKLIVQPENCPDWLTTGQTTLIAKKEPTLAEKQRQVLLKIVHE